MATFHIVIADGDSRIGELLRRTVAVCLPGVRITVVADGQAALDICASQRVDLLLTDYLMPKLDGIDLARTLRACGKRLLIVLISSVSVDRAVVDACGVDLYIAKPWSMADLGRLLDRARLLIHQQQMR